MKKTLIITTIALFAVCFLVAAREGISRDMCANEDIQVCIDRTAACALGEDKNISADPEFVEAVGRGSSQGRLDGKGVRLALYALYGAERDLGFYGLEAASQADVDRLEDALRGVWAHNVGLDRARVHRGNLALVVVWHDGVSLDCWEAVNSGIAQRLVDP